MDTEGVLMILGASFVIGTGIALVAMVRNALKTQKKVPLEPETEDAEAETAEKKETFSVTVTDMSCRVYSKGIKIPKTVREFNVVFTDAEGKGIEISVDEELYSAFETGQRGTLTMIGGMMYSFELDEDSPEKLYDDAE